MAAPEGADCKAGVGDGGRVLICVWEAAMQERAVFISEHLKKRGTESGKEVFLAR